jgi:hypothetical protein
MPIFPDVSRRISHIFTEYYAKTSGKKLNHILTEGERAVAALKLPESNFDWWVDKNRVGQLVISYYLDVIKYKEYPLIVRPYPAGMWM